jgi:hypothetical protein
MSKEWILVIREAYYIADILSNIIFSCNELVITYEDIAYANLLRAKAGGDKIKQKESKCKPKWRIWFKQCLTFVKFAFGIWCRRNDGKRWKLEDVPENDITFVQKLKSFLGIQRDMTVQIATKMMMEGAEKARKKKLTWIGHHCRFCRSGSILYDLLKYVQSNMY